MKDRTSPQFIQALLAATEAGLTVDDFLKQVDASVEKIEAAAAKPKRKAKRNRTSRVGRYC